MRAEVEVLQPGLFSSIQDRGRFDFLKFGVPLSGPMDNYAARVANLILQNDPKAAVLEITQQGPKLKFSAPVDIALSGADLSPRINNNAIKNHRVYSLQAGDVLQFGRRIAGCRAYLAVSGGFQTQEVLGSRSWYEGISEEYRLVKRMKLEYFSRPKDLSQSFSSLKVEIDYLSQQQVEVYEGPEFSRIPEKIIEELFRREFSLSKNSSRMGIQLTELLENQLSPIITGPVVPGTVQLTPGGRLIVLMKDCQTTGGYPRVLQLSQRGMNLLAQKLPGENIGFRLLS